MRGSSYVLAVRFVLCISDRGSYDFEVTTKINGVPLYVSHSSLSSILLTPPLFLKTNFCRVLQNYVHASVCISSSEAVTPVLALYNT